MIDKTFIDTLVAHGQVLAGSDKYDGGNRYIVLPEKHVVVPLAPMLEAHQPNPFRVRQKVALGNPESFVRYINLYKTADTKIFATAPTAQCPKFEAIIDYHQDRATWLPEALANAKKAEKDNDVVIQPEPLPQWCSHRATYQAEFSPEWVRWMDKDRKRMTQEEFAIWLEENQELIIDPSGAALLELVQTLEGKANITCNQLIRLNNGRQKLVYDEEVTLKGITSHQAGEIEFPVKLAAAIPPFVGDVHRSYRVACRLRYRIESRRLMFWFEVVDKHLILADVVAKTVAYITEQTGIQPMIGSV